MLLCDCVSQRLSWGGFRLSGAETSTPLGGGSGPTEVFGREEEALPIDGPVFRIAQVFVLLVAAVALHLDVAFPSHDSPRCGVVVRSPEERRESREGNRASATGSKGRGISSF